MSQEETINNAAEKYCETQYTTPLSFLSQDKLECTKDFKSGALWMLNNIKGHVLKLRETYRNDDSSAMGSPYEKRKYMLGKCNAACDFLDLLDGKPINEICYVEKTNNCMPSEY